MTANTLLLAVIAIGGIVFAGLGYITYKNGLQIMPSHTSESPWGELLVSGVGMGIFLMASGVILLFLILYAAFSFQKPENSASGNSLDGTSSAIHDLESRIAILEKSAKPQNPAVSGDTTPEKSVIENSISVTCPAQLQSPAIIKKSTPSAQKSPPNPSKCVPAQTKPEN